MSVMSVKVFAFNPKFIYPQIFSVHQERDGNDELRQEAIEEGHGHGQLRQEAIDDELP